MPKIPHKSFTSSKKSLPIIPNQIKYFLILLTITFSYFSGQIPFNSSRDHTRFVADATEIHHPNNSTQLSSEKPQPYQIKQIDIVQAIAPTATPVPPTPTVTNNNWGVAKKIDTHTYTMQVKNDATIATPQEILTALNNFRAQHGSAALAWDDNLANFAASRAHTFSGNGTLDNHQGFLDFLNNQNGFKKLGFSSIGENSSYGFTLEAVHLIEWVYAGDEEHNSNQLNNSWHYVGIGVEGTATDLVFAGNKL